MDFFRGQILSFSDQKCIILLSIDGPGLWPSIYGYCSMKEILATSLIVVVVDISLCHRDYR